MDKKQFRNLVTPLNEREKLYQREPERSLEYYNGPDSLTQYSADGVILFPATVATGGGNSEHGAVLPGAQRTTAVNGSLTLLKQTRFSQVPLHRHEYIEMNYMYTGHCTALINGRRVEMAEGDVAILDSGVVHTILPTGEADILLNCLMARQYFTAGFVERLAAGGPIPRFLSTALTESQDHDHYLLFHTAQSPNFKDWMESLFCEYFDPGVCADGAINSYMNLIFIELARCYQGAKESEYRQASKRYLTEILRYMDENCVSCTLEGTAAHFGFHPNYLSRMIRQATGSNFKDLIADGRLSRAAFLLRSTATPIQQIAQQCGYLNQSFFYRKFSARYHCTPAEYRQGR